MTSQSGHLVRCFLQVKKYPTIRGFSSSKFWIGEAGAAIMECILVGGALWWIWLEILSKDTNRKIKLGNGLLLKRKYILNSFRIVQNMRKKLVIIELDDPMTRQTNRQDYLLLGFDVLMNFEVPDESDWKGTKKWFRKKIWLLLEESIVWISLSNVICNDSRYIL